MGLDPVVIMFQNLHTADENRTVVSEVGLSFCTGDSDMASNTIDQRPNLAATGLTLPSKEGYLRYAMWLIRYPAGASRAGSIEGIRR